MAHVNFDGLNLRITLDRPERRAVHVKEFVVPRANLGSVRHDPDVWAHVRRDIGVMGLGFPRIILWGTAWNGQGKDFCILHKPGPGLVISLRDHPYDRVLLTLPDAQSWPLYARLREVIAQDSRDRSTPG
jgi:hypothetical protein